MLLKTICYCLLFSFLSACITTVPDKEVPKQIPTQIDTLPVIKQTVFISRDVQVKDYFQYLDSLINNFNLEHTYTVSEHVLVRHNPWIIDTLANTDYYRRMEKDSFVYNQKDEIILNKGSQIIIPDSLETQNLLDTFKSTWIDVNIPEFKLRIYKDSIKLYEFPVRVGRNEKKYLKMGDRVTDLRTIPGTGKIVAHVKNPDYHNPTTGQQYYNTNRDDKKNTQLPQIPFIETEINGIRYGQLIHPTTNPKSLGKAYSNGCIGTKEADAWIIYYYAPIDTKISIRYDLNIINEDGEYVKLKDIYEKEN